MTELELELSESSAEERVAELLSGIRYQLHVVTFLLGIIAGSVIID